MVRAAFVVTKLNLPKQLKIHSKAAVFQGAVVLAEALQFSLTEVQEKYTSIHIFSDSKAVLSALNSFQADQYKSGEIAECYFKLIKLMVFETVVLQWVPSHVGILGNKLADCKAKATASQGTCRDCSTPIINSQPEHICKFVLQESFENTRDQSFNPFVTCKLLWTFEKSMYNKLSKREGWLLLRLMSGHCGTKNYRARFNGEDGACISCSEDETVEHMLLDCEVYWEKRENIYNFSRERFSPASLFSILGWLSKLNNNLEKVRIVIQFLSDIEKDYKL